MCITKYFLTDYVHVFIYYGWSLFSEIVPFCYFAHCLLCLGGDSFSLLDLEEFEVSGIILGQNTLFKLILHIFILPKLRCQFLILLYMIISMNNLFLLIRSNPILSHSERINCTLIHFIHHVLTLIRDFPRKFNCFLAIQCLRSINWYLRNMTFRTIQVL